MLKAETRLDPQVAGQLRDLVGADRVLTDGDLRSSFEQDQTGRYDRSALAVLVPESGTDAAKAMEVCAAAGIPVIAQGGNTGLSGGTVPAADQVIMSLSRLGHVGEPDPLSHQLDVGAGATMSQVQKKARDSGLEFPIDFPSRDTATIGGMIATNAAGASAFRWGAMNRQVRGLQMVLADGTQVARGHGLLKDNAGFNWIDLLCGSEGTLGIITGARLQLQPPPAERIAAVIGVADLASVTETRARLVAALGFHLESMDYVSRDVLEMVSSHTGRQSPLDGDFGVLLYITLSGDSGLFELLDSATADLPENSIVAEESTSGRAALWSTREAVNHSMRSAGAVLKYDVGLPLANIPTFVRDLREELHVRFNARLFDYGHIGDGNLHLSVLGVHLEDESVDELVLGLVGERQGTINSEHGVGLTKRKFLHLTRSQEEIRLMRAIKRALDPNGLLNPGKVLPE
jgi:FAD/FMN-containing dehydrogenase